MSYKKPFMDSIPYAARITYIDSRASHRHCEAELIFCLRGEITANINGTAVSVLPGETLFVSPFASHSYESEEKAKAVFAEFGYGLLKEDFLSLMSLGEFFKVFSENHRVSEKMTELTEILASSESFSRLELTGQLYSLCGELLRGLKTGDCPSEHSDLERIAPALRLVETNYTDGLTIEDACRETGLSPGNFCTLFKNAVGTGFHAYLNHKRAETAGLLLGQTDLPVGEVAELSGFSDIKTFYRVFRKETGVPPLNFRKM